MTEPVATYGNLRFWDNFGEYGFATKLRVEGLRNLGGVLSPFNAFLLLHGMETLPLRMDAHVANAQIVAEFLEADERVSWVRYGGLPNDPNHALRQKYLPKGPARCSRSGSPRAARRASASSARSSCARTSPTSATRGRS
jgi:O-acetylhomoserine (thiol)-lyase